MLLCLFVNLYVLCLLCFHFYDNKQQYHFIIIIISGCVCLCARINSLCNLYNNDKLKSEINEYAYAHGVVIASEIQPFNAKMLGYNNLDILGYERKAEGGDKK